MHVESHFNVLLITSAGYLSGEMQKSGTGWLLVLDRKVPFFFYMLRRCSHSSSALMREPFTLSFAILGTTS